MSGKLRGEQGLVASGIVLGAVSPHPPIIIPEIGEQNLERVSRTRDGLQQLAGLVTELNPDTVVIISPHGPVLRNSLTLLTGPILEGNFREFGISGTSLRYGNDTRLVNRAVTEAQERNVPVHAADPAKAATFLFPGTLHYSVLVPLYYLKQAGYEGRLVAGAADLLPVDKLYAFGQAVQAASLELGVRVVYIASGDLSHRLTEGAPAGFDPMGEVFDRKVVEALSRADAKTLLSLDPELVERAGECGLGPILTMLGALDGLSVVPDVLSYEGPFGVGYCVATFLPRPGAGAKVGTGDAAAPHPLVKLARLSLETYVREGRKIAPPAGAPGLDARAGAFVSLKKNGQLRGCIGTIEATSPSLAEEVIRNAIQAGTADPRFHPVRAEELPELDYSVDVLEPAEPVAGPEDLDPKVYGVIVTKGHRTGLLLPNLEGVNTVEEQVSIARQKAGIGPNETGVATFRFKVTRYH